MIEFLRKLYNIRYFMSLGSKFELPLRLIPAKKFYGLFRVQFLLAKFYCIVEI